MRFVFYGLLLLGVLASCTETQELACGQLCPSGQICNVETGQCMTLKSTSPNPNETGLYNSMIMGPKGQLWVATHEQTQAALVLQRFNANGDLEYSEVVDTGPQTGFYPSLARSDDGRFHIAYYNREQGKARFATLDKGSWSIEETENTESIDSGQWMSMTLDGNGGRHVAYQDITHGRLVMESLDSAACRPNWANPQNKLPGSKDYGAYASIGISGTTQETAQLVASFYDKSGGNLVLATCHGELLSFQLADGHNTKTDTNTGNVGLWSSLAIEPKSRKPAVAYFDQTHGTLKYVQSQQGALAVAVVDDGIRSLTPTRHLVGQHAALEFNSATGQPRIAYLDSTARAVRLAVRSQHGSWSSTKLVSLDTHLIGGLGMGVELVLNKEDRAWVLWGKWQLTDGSIHTETELVSCDVGQNCGELP